MGLLRGALIRLERCFLRTSLCIVQICEEGEKVTTKTELTTYQVEFIACRGQMQTRATVNPLSLSQIHYGKKKKKRKKKNINKPYLSAYSIAGVILNRMFAVFPEQICKLDLN